MHTMPDERAMTASEVRHRLYEIASEAHIGALAAAGDDETMIAFRRLLARIDQQLCEIAGGETFDLLERLEKGKAVAS